MKTLVEATVTCPHCWKRFHGDRAWYISSHAKLIGDSVLGSVQKRYSPTDVTLRRDKVLDEEGWEMVQRACPRCHLQIPDHLLNSRAKFISIAGAPRAGKTYFLTIMLHQLKKTLSQQFNYTLGYADSEEKRLAIEYEEKIFSSANPMLPVMLPKTEMAGDHLYNTVHLDGVDVQLPKPFMLTLRKSGLATFAKGNVRTEGVVLYDNAGESFRVGAGDGSKHRETQHLSESDAILFTYDPLLDTDTRVRLATCSDDPQVNERASTARQVDILEEVIHRMRRMRPQKDGGPMDVALAVCVQKYDVWKPLIAYHKYQGQSIVDATSIQHLPEKCVTVLDLTDVNIVSSIVRGLLEATNPQFVAIAESSFRHVRYFPVSSLGHSPQEHEGFLKIRPIDIQSFRVDHPFLWLMYLWKMVPISKSRTEKPRGLPVASIAGHDKGKIVINCPSSAGKLLLDDDHAGREFYNPSTLEYFWIPGVPAPQPSQQSPSSSKATGTKKGLNLQLPDPSSENSGRGKQKKSNWWPFK